MGSRRWGVCAAAAVVVALPILIAAKQSEPTLKYVTYGSSIKLEHVNTEFRLHSHEIPYGSGSQQQSVTAYPDAGDVNSYWLVKEAHLAVRRPAGEAVKCGDTVRLQHVQTGKNLHSHLHRAPITDDYEVSAYREDEEAARWNDGDGGDNWTIVCDKNGGEWERFARVSLKHVDTGSYLSSSRRNKFSHPTAGQLQVCASKRMSRDTYWKTNEGIFMHPPEEKKAKN